MREDGPPWALLEFGRAIRIAVGVVEEGGKAFKEGCVRVVCRRMMSTACYGGLSTYVKIRTGQKKQTTDLGTVLHTIEKGWRYSTGPNRWTSRSVALE
jgi:hypothetical protein